MAGKGIGDILKIVELLKNGLAGVCLFLAGHNLWQLLQGKGSRREIIHAFLWAGLASVAVILSELGKNVWGQLEPQVAEAMAKGIKSSWLNRPRGLKKRYYQHLIYKYRSYRTQGLKTKGPFSLDLEKNICSLEITARECVPNIIGINSKTNQGRKARTMELIGKEASEDFSS